MSRTEIYLLEPDEYELLEFKNAWRGAMYVWNDIAKRYCGFERFPLGIFDGDDERQIDGSASGERSLSARPANGHRLAHKHGGVA